MLTSVIEVTFLIYQRLLINFNWQFYVEVLNCNQHYFYSFLSFSRCDQLRLACPVPRWWCCFCPSWATTPMRRPCRTAPEPPTGRICWSTTWPGPATAAASWPKRWPCCARAATRWWATIDQVSPHNPSSHRPILTVPVRHNVIPEYLSDQPQQPVEVEVATLPDSGVTSRGYPHSRSAHRRVRREGIYDECCKKSCSYTQLKSYCEWGVDPDSGFLWWQAAWVSQTPPGHPARTADLRVFDFITIIFPGRGKEPRIR